ncbi:MAG: type II secretion system protein M [Proteobacteria bacterium]|nr:type II secretion system protein M [Pseudomonadota bacterium]
MTKLTSLLAVVDKMSLRERLLVFGAGMMLLGSVWYLGLMQPLTKQVTRNRTEIASLQERTKTTNQNLEVQALQISNTGAEDREKFERVQQRLDEMNERLGGYAAELIDPAEMSRVLQGVLKEQSKLRLIRARNISHGAMSASAEAETTTFYRHGLEIEFEGSYLACLEYLQQLEALPWRFYWQFLEIEVLEYPRNRIRLEVSTLSPDEEWIGA